MKKSAVLWMVLTSLLFCSSAKPEIAEATGGVVKQKGVKRTGDMSLDLGGGVKLDLALIRPGTFLMGSEIRDDGAKPVHEVTISQPFYLGKYEVTQAQWEAVMGSNPSRFKGANLPVDMISWEDSQVFIEKLNSKGLGTFRLPTEAEWEYACRAGTTGEYAGDLDKMAWYKVNSDRKTHPVGTKKSNAWGLYDMHGNVFEWCHDGARPYNQEKQIDPRGPATGSTRIIRGGNFFYSALCCRSAYRASESLSGRGATNPNWAVGFRLVMMVPEVAGGVVKPKGEKGIGAVDKPKVAEGIGGVAKPEIAEATGGIVKQKGVKGTGDMSLDLGGGVKLDLALIRPGTFLMGSKNGDDNEKPVHRVTISRPFYLGKYEVTQAQWEAVMGSNPSRSKGAALPVENVSWEDCQKFIEKLNSKGGGTFRLPTEAEWEYACRAGTTGDLAGNLDEMAWYVENSGNKTHPVGTKKPNAWGLYDMHGNVWEWCQDRYGEYGPGKQIDPRGPATGFSRVFRVGCFGDKADLIRSAARSGNSPSYRLHPLGFRLVREVP